MTIKNEFSVVQIIDALHIGGAEFIAIALADNLSYRGFDSHLVTTRNTGQMVERVNPKVKVWSANRSWRYDISGFRKIANYIRSNNIKIVHSHSHTTGYIVNLIRKFTNLQFIHVFHDHDSNVTRNLLYNLLDFTLLKGVDLYISVSNELLERSKNLLRLTNDKCFYLNNCVIVSNESRRFHSKGKVVIQVANIHAHKGYTTAVRSAAILRKQIPDLQWLCVGGTVGYPLKYIQELRSLIDELGVRETIKLIGQQSDVRKLLQQADVAVLTSYKEGLPIALLEYMAEGLPVVVTDVGDSGNLVRAANCGFIANPGDHHKIAEHIFTLLTKPELAKKNGKNGRQYVEKNHNMDSLITQVVELYYNLIKNKIN